MTVTTAVPIPIMSERQVSLIGALLVAMGPLAMTLYLPAMSEITQAFHTTESMVKLTLTFYFGGFATAQLVAGPLSDAIGRRPVVFTFIGIFCAATVMALFAPSIEALIAARFVQGVGASAGIAISRAIIRDLFKGAQSSRIMNLIGIILAVGPAFAPTVGGAMLALFGWRSIFVLMLFLGGAVLLISSLTLRETVIPDRKRLKPLQLLRSYGQLLTHRQFLSATFVVAGAIGALYAQTTFLPFILMDEVGLTPTQFGVGMLMHSGAFFVGSLSMRPLMPRFSGDTLVRVGLGFLLLGGCGNAMLLIWEPSFLRVMLPVSLYSFGISFVMPVMTTAALAPFPTNAGAAAAMMGFMQLGTGLVVGTVGALFGDTSMAMATLIPAMALLASLCYGIFRRDAAYSSA
ncbi:multidrug effflux MFS transporter [Actibacterium sp. D379-3]